MRMGIVGTNFVSDWLCEAAHLLPDLTLAAVFSRADATGRAFAASHGIDAVYTDYDSFLASGLDAVYIATPNSCHEGQARRALQAGVSVLCEKPIMLNKSSLQELTCLARYKNLVLMEAMRPLHDPAFALLRATLPALGRLRQAHFSYCQYSSRYDRFKQGEVLNAFTPSLGNAAVMDIGVYPLSLCAALFGMPAAVWADSVFLPGGMEGAGNVLLSYGSFSVTVSYAKICDSPCRCTLCGEAGFLTFEKPACPENFVLTLRDGSSRALDTRPAANNLVYELNDFAGFVGALRTGRRPEALAFFEQVSLDTAELLDAVRQKAGIVFPGLDP